MTALNKQALNQEKIEWLNKLADMEYCKSNPGHWLMSLKDTNMLAKLALRSVALLASLEAAEKRIAELEAREILLPERSSMLHRTDFHDDYQTVMAYKVSEVIAAIRAAGIRIKGE